MFSPYVHPRLTTSVLRGSHKLFGAMGFGVQIELGNTSQEEIKSSNLCPGGWVGKAMGEGMSDLGQRRSVCKGPEAAPPFVSPGCFSVYRSVFP